MQIQPTLKNLSEYILTALASREPRLWLFSQQNAHILTGHLFCQRFPKTQPPQKVDAVFFGGGIQTPRGSER